MTAAPATYARDVGDRQRLFDPRSFQHDARAHLGLLDDLLDRYTRRGDLVLDPMAGTGSLFLGTVKHRRVVCGELENWLTRRKPGDLDLPILESNRRRAGKWSHFPNLAYQGDATKLPFAQGSIDHILLSPPYWDTFSDWHIGSHRLKRRNLGPHGSAYGDDRGRKVKRNIGNLHTYEHFLTAMRVCFVEWGRVLKDQGRLVLIVKDKIKGGQQVPIVHDLTTVLKAVGFTIEESWARTTQLTQYRQVHKAQGQPVIDEEWVIVARNWHIRTGRIRLDLVMVPDAAGPPRLVYEKALDHARRQTCHVYHFRPDRAPYVIADRPEVGLRGAVYQVPDLLANAKFKLREGVGRRVCEELVDLGLRTGDRVSLHVAMRYATYIEERLTTLGMRVEVPTRGLNMGQKQSYYTREA